ncbi:energy transducer TonB [Thalassotalea marina]|uniref:TonB C-terminal domain-containing protein n=1 Tax=Thalassotalea marina TaxID=1673741 RepID=A0A919BNZ1_9GAMM|nr:energy transducer TonB [Thalassotalea marina]GHG02370.1 hypothetical protein GCM10017161_34030 [Thalassotalea marina]
MNSKFDKDIAELYQQRQDNIDAPKIMFKETRIVRKYSLVKSLSILLMGGVASFAIFAIITHLAKSPNHKIVEAAFKHQVVIIPEIAAEALDEPTIVKSSLPKEPEVNNPDMDRPLTRPEVIPKPRAETQLNLKLENPVLLPSMTKPEYHVEPTYKILPDYPEALIKMHKTGQVTLRYEIDENGRVKNISVVENQGDKRFRRASQSALAKWVYPPQADIERVYEVVFEFKIP